MSTPWTPPPRLEVVREPMTDEDAEKLRDYWIDQYGVDLVSETTSAGEYLMGLLLLCMLCGAVTFGLGLLVGWWLL